MNYGYQKSNQTWNGLKSYNLNGKGYEGYEAPVTLSLPEWRDYVAAGKNTLYAGAIVPAGTEGPGWGSSAVYRGHVRQGWNM